LNAKRAATSASAGCSRCTPTKREEISEVWAGDIAAAVGLRNVTTGDTICDPKHPVVLESMSFPEPVIRGLDRAQEPRPTRRSSAWRSAS